MNRSLTATLRYAQTSDKKMELVAKLVRGKDAQQAMNILQFAPKKSAKILLKVVKSAVANATKKRLIETQDLRVAKIDIGRWQKLKRVRFVARSRVHSYVKYRTFVRVVLDNK